MITDGVGTDLKKEEDLEWSPKTVEHLKIRKRVRRQQRILRRGD